MKYHTNCKSYRKFSVNKYDKNVKEVSAASIQKDLLTLEEQEVCICNHTHTHTHTHTHMHTHTHTHTHTCVRACMSDVCNEVMMIIWLRLGYAFVVNFSGISDGLNMS